MGKENNPTIMKHAVFACGPSGVVGKLLVAWIHLSGKALGGHVLSNSGKPAETQGEHLSKFTEGVRGKTGLQLLDPQTCFHCTVSAMNHYET